MHVSNIYPVQNATFVYTNLGQKVSIENKTSRNS